MTPATAAKQNKGHGPSVPGHPTCPTQAWFQPQDPVPTSWAVATGDLPRVLLRPALQPPVVLFLFLVKQSEDKRGTKLDSLVLAASTVSAPGDTGWAETQVVAHLVKVMKEKRVPWSTEASTACRGQPVPSDICQQAKEGLNGTWAPEKAMRAELASRAPGQEGGGGRERRE